MVKKDYKYRKRYKDKEYKTLEKPRRPMKVPYAPDYFPPIIIDKDAPTADPEWRKSVEPSEKLDELMISPTISASASPSPSCSEECGDGGIKGYQLVRAITINGVFFRKGCTFWTDQHNYVSGYVSGDKFMLLIGHGEYYALHIGKDVRRI